MTASPPGPPSDPPPRGPPPTPDPPPPDPPHPSPSPHPQPDGSPRNPPPPTGPPHDPGIPPAALPATDWTEQLPPQPPGPPGPWPAGPGGPSAAPSGQGHDDSPRSGFLAGLGMLGAGLATAAALVGATLFPRPGDDFNQPAFLVVTGLTLALVVLTVGSELVLGGRDRTRAVPGTFAALAAVHLGVVVALLLGDSGATGYVTGAVIVLAAAAAYVWLRSAPPVAAVVLGGLVFVGELLDDTAGGGADSTSNLGVGVGLVVYGVAVAAAGWRLPSRHVSAMLGGAVALLGAEAVIVGGLLLQAFGGGSLLAPDSTAAPSDPFGGVADPTGDVAVAMVLGLLVCAGLLGLHAYTRFPGYAVLGVVGTVLVAWSGLFGLYVDSVLRWGAGIGVAGVLLAAGALLALGGGRRGIGPRLRQGVVRLPRRG